MMEINVSVQYYTGGFLPDIIIMNVDPMLLQSENNITRLNMP